MATLRVKLGLVSALVALVALVAIAGPGAAHGVAEEDRAFLEENQGTQVGAFLVLGAKHMVTGYDHLLFLAGVVFFGLD